MKSDKYRVSSTHAEDLADGRLLEPGETAKDVDEKDPHNKRLINDGKLVKIGSSKSGSTSDETTSEEDS
jgi:hypothetical protein